MVASLNDHRLLNANAAFHDLTGHDAGHVVGQTPSDLTLWDTAATRRRLENELKTSGRLNKVDARIQTKDGILLDCLVSAATISVGDDPCALCGGRSGPSSCSSCLLAGPQSIASHLHPRPSGPCAQFHRTRLTTPMTTSINMLNEWID